MRSDKRVFMVGMAGVLVGVLMVAMLPAVAAVVGDPLGLGEVNKIDDRTDLKGKAKGANLQIKNTGNAAAISAKADRNAIKAKATGGPVALNAKASRNAVKIRVDAGRAPLKVNAAAGTATNLSADLLDGLDSAAFLGAGEKAVDSELLDGLDSTAFLQSAEMVVGHRGGEQSEQVTPTDEIVQTLTFTPAADGTVIVNSSLTASEDTAGDTVRCSITTGVLLDPDFLQVWESGGALGSNASQMAGTRGFNPTAGEEFTANLVCDQAGSSGSATIFDSVLTAIFIPSP